MPILKREDAVSLNNGLTVTLIILKIGLSIKFKHPPWTEDFPESPLALVLELLNDEDKLGVEGLDWRTLTDIEHWLEDKQDAFFDAEALCTREEPDILLDLFIIDILQDEVNEVEKLDEVVMQDELEPMHSHFSLES